MRSSDGRHWIALDHIRAVAALMVFNWHFLHGVSGKPIPYDYVPTMFPLAILDEGYIGVALFMALSGYLFAKLLAGKDIVYGRFFWNRFIRLAPLLIFTLVLVGIMHALQEPAFSYFDYAHDVLTGFVLPTWPNGGWSIAVEMQFYIMLPLAIMLTRRWPIGLFLLILATVLFRASGAMQVPYFTLAGHLDQFVFGIIAFQYREHIRGRHWLTAVIVIAALWALARTASFGEASSAAIPPAVHGAVFAWLIAYYDASFALPVTGFSKLLGRVGTYSYSIYLLHPFFVFRLPLFINHRFFSLSNFYVACAVALVCFCGMAVISWTSYSLIEKPFLRFRVRYTRPQTEKSAGLAVA